MGGSSPRVHPLLFLNHPERDLIDLAAGDSVDALIALTKRRRILYNQRRAEPLAMPGLARFPR